MSEQGELKGSNQARLMGGLGKNMQDNPMLVAWALPMLGDSFNHYAIGHSPDRYDLLASARTDL